ncbi:stress-activated map kinase-interacting protein 1 [Drosophila sulfurigaster albostrigata]|uniref:stress-activated map kinase-interacting protein 1 n=1 Tax=Drosophila sulfurigaster albostrigata TaxID=89887 RepID=UPI002D21C2B7|nr:stress-activated map kinase-interacting protein 1 [Drosophila sulfurigaster albostrigata]
MATYSNQHWLLSHIRNSFISTDDTGICETVMLSDDMPKHYLRRFQTATTTMDAHRRSGHRPPQATQQQRNSVPKTPDTATQSSQRSAPLQHMVPPRIADPPLQEVDFYCYPGLDLSDDEDLDMSTHSFDIQMYPEVGAHRFRSNTAQKLEKLDIAKRKAARIKSVNYNEEVLPPDRQDFFVRKPVNGRPAEKPSTSTATATVTKAEKTSEDDLSDEGVKSKLSEQLAKSPKQTQNRFIQYARFDGTAQVGMPTKRINVYVNMLPEPERNYPLKICVLSTAKIIEVIGLVCYKTTLQYPDAVQLKSVQHYALYMTEDNDDMDDFPPLDNREPCSKFGFSHLTLAERRPLAPVTRIDYQQGTKSITSMDDKAAVAAARALENINLNGDVTDGAAGTGDGGDSPQDHVKEYEKRLLNHNDMLEAPMHRTYRLSIIDKRFFKCDVTLSVSGERIEIDQHKNAKFWAQRKPVSTPIDLVAHCEIVEQRQLKALLRIWLKSNSSSGMSSSCTSAPISASITSLNAGNNTTGIAHSPGSPGHYPSHSSHSPFGQVSSMSNIRFKHYDFDTDVHTAEQIRNKLNCILEMRSSDIRREFLHQRVRKQEKQQAKRQLKL